MPFLEVNLKSKHHLQGHLISRLISVLASTTYSTKNLCVNIPVEFQFFSLSVRKMTQKFAVLFISVAVLASLVSCKPLESNYQKYLRTRPPQAPGEVHVEEVLEVFRTRERPPSYGVYNAQVNAFLANSALRRRKLPISPTRHVATTTARTTTSTTTTTTSTIAPVLVTRTTYPTPTRDNVNPDYTNPFQPSISVTKYPSFKVPQTIIIQEGEQQTRPVSTVTENVPKEEDYEDVTTDNDKYSYSNEEYFEQLDD